MPQAAGSLGVTSSRCRFGAAQGAGGLNWEPHPDSASSLTGPRGGGGAARGPCPVRGHPGGRWAGWAGGGPRSRGARRPGLCTQSWTAAERRPGATRQGRRFQLREPSGLGHSHPALRLWCGCVDEPARPCSNATGGGWPWPQARACRPLAGTTSSYWGALGAALSQNRSGSRPASRLSTCLPRF